MKNRTIVVFYGMETSTNSQEEATSYSFLVALEAETKVPSKKLQKFTIIDDYNEQETDLFKKEVYNIFHQDQKREISLEKLITEVTGVHQNKTDEKLTKLISILAKQAEDLNTEEKSSPSSYSGEQLIDSVLPLFYNKPKKDSDIANNIACIFDRMKNQYILHTYDTNSSAKKAKGLKKFKEEKKFISGFVFGAAIMWGIPHIMHRLFCH
jgi:hypothetical protein